MTINLGDKFESFSSFKKAFEIFQAETNTQFSVFYSKSLEHAKHRSPRCERAPDILKYYAIKYMCVHGGSFKKSHSRGLRSISTLKIGCPALIYLLLSKDERSLVVKGLNLEHNHDTNEPLFVEVPTHRKRNLAKLRVQLTESKSKKKRRKASKNIHEDAVNVAHLQDSTKLNASNTQIYLTPDGTECAAPYGLASDETVCEAPNETEMNQNHATPGGEEESNEHKLCKCAIGTFDLTKQDLMKMEVEEHYHRLEVLQLQKAYETERIEKMRYLYDLKIKLAEQELQNSNF